MRTIVSRWCVLGALLALGSIPIARGAAAAAPAPTAAPAVDVTYLSPLPGGSSSAAWDINRWGTVAGWSATAGVNGHAVVWRSGRVIDLGVLPGSDSSVAYAINDRDQVVGESGGRAVLWSRGRIRDLGTLPGGTWSVAWDLNNDGVVVGGSDSRNRTGLLQPVMWVGGRIVRLGTPTGLSTAVAHGVNEAGVVVGSGGLRWDCRGFTVLPPLPGHPGAELNAVNERGQIAGISVPPGGWVDGVTPVLWNRGRPHALPVPDGVGISVAEDVNDWGDIVGSIGQGAEVRPVLWWKGSLVLLESAGGYGEALAMNGAGQIVGYSQGPSNIGTVWTVRADQP